MSPWTVVVLGWWVLCALWIWRVMALNRSARRTLDWLKVETALQAYRDRQLHRNAERNQVSPLARCVRCGQPLTVGFRWLGGTVLMISCPQHGAIELQDCLDEQPTGQDYGV